MSRAAVDIVTGFLGAGKTTFLVEAINGGPLEGEKVAVVMNEIGDIGIDGRVVTGLDYVENVVELNSGCICCTIDDYRFDMAINELVEAVDPALIVIETTGLADPEPVIYRVKQAGLALDAVTTLVDAANFARVVGETEVASAQVRAADFLVLNKLDLIEPAQKEKLERRLGRLNSRAVLLEADHGRLDSNLPFGISARRYRQGIEEAAAGGEGSHLERDKMDVFSCESKLYMDQRQFERFLDRLPQGVYRAKGFVRLAGNAWSCLFNFTCGRYELSWIKLGDEPVSSQAVFIGRGINAEKERITNDFAACGDSGP